MLMHHRVEKNESHHKKREGEIIFDPSVMLRTSLADGFRIFTDPTKLTHIPATQLTNPQRGVTMANEAIVVYTDGSCMNNGKENTKSGAGIWIAENHPDNRAVRVPTDKQSNQAGELTVVLVAIQNTPNFAPLQIKTDSRYVIDGLT